MNKSKARNVSITEMKDILPLWFYENFRITFRLLSTNTYIDFQRIKTLLVASLSHLMPKEKDKIKIKHVLVEVGDKGIKENYQYITVDVFVVIPSENKESEILKITKSCKVKLCNSYKKSN